MLLEAHCRRALWFIFTVLIHGRLCPNTFIQPPCKHKDIRLEKWNVQVQRAMCTTLGSSGTSGWSSPPPPPPPQLHHLPLTHHHLDLYFCHQVLFTKKFSITKLITTKTTLKFNQINTTQAPLSPQSPPTRTSFCQGITPVHHPVIIATAITLQYERDYKWYLEETCVPTSIFNCTLQTWQTLQNWQ